MKTVCVITGGGSGMGLAAAKCMPNKLKGYQASGLAYGLSKKFVIRYAAKCAYEYGAKGIRVFKPEDIQAALEEARQNTKTPTLIEFIIDPEDLVYPMVKPGGTLEELIMDC